MVGDLIKSFVLFTISCCCVFSFRYSLKTNGVVNHQRALHNNDNDCLPRIGCLLHSATNDDQYNSISIVNNDLNSNFDTFRQKVLTLHRLWGSICSSDAFPPIVILTGDEATNTSIDDESISMIIKYRY